MIYPNKVYIPIVHGFDIYDITKWDVIEINTAKAKKAPVHIVPGYVQYNGCIYSAINIFLSPADAWDWVHLFSSYRGKMYTAAEIGSIREVIAK